MTAVAVPFVLGTETVVSVSRPVCNESRLPNSREIREQRSRNNNDFPIRTHTDYRLNGTVCSKSNLQLFVVAV